MIHRVGEFEKVSYEQFESDLWDCCLEIEQMSKISLDTCTESQQTEAENRFRLNYETIQIPERKTAGSAGFDISSRISFVLAPGQSVRIPTGLRVKIDEGWMLAVFPRSGLGFKYRLQLDNTVGIVDSDYYNSANEGHIFLKVTNDSKEGKDIEVYVGDRIAQAIFIPYGITYSDHAEGERNGGFGSTGIA